MMGIISPGKVRTSTPSVKEAPHKASQGQTGKCLKCIFLPEGAEVLKSCMLVLSFKKPQKPLHSSQRWVSLCWSYSPSECSVFSQTCPGAATWPLQTAQILCCGQGSGFEHRLLPSSCSSLIFPVIPLHHSTHKWTNTQTNKQKHY